jgi:DNA mismatch repair protein MutS
MVHSHDFYTLYQKAYDKYTELYGQKVCVFLQKGSFFEFYGQMDPKTQKQLNTGKEIIDLLGIVLHTYPDDGPEGTTGFYGGVPTHTLDKWAEKLTSLGWSVVVIEEIKNGAQKVSKREVTHVLSPGTHCAVADPRKTFFLGSLWLDKTVSSEPPSFGVSVADLTTGQVYLYEGVATGKADVWHTDDLRHLFQVYAPRELLLYIRGPTADVDLEVLRRTFHIPTAPIIVKHATQEQQGAFEKGLAREEFLRGLFQPKSALPLRTWLRVKPDGSSLSERAMTCLLRFAEDHAPKLASCLQAPIMWHPTQNLQIINNALTQLNLFTDAQQSVLDLFAPPQTAMGKRSLTGRLCSPVACSEIIAKRQDELCWILQSTKQKQRDIEGCLALIYDLARIHRAIIKGTVKPADVVQLHQSYQSATQLWKLLNGSPFADGDNQGHALEKCLAEFKNLFDVKKAYVALEHEGELWCLQDSFAQASAGAEDEVKKIYKKAQGWLDTLTATCKVSQDACKFKPTEKNMFCVHLTKSTSTTMQNQLKQLDAAVIAPYKKTQFKILTSAARLEDPQLDTYQETLDVAKAHLKRCIDFETPKACIQYSEQTRNLWTSLEEWIIQVDLANTMAKTAEQQGWVKPTIESSSTTDPSRVRIENLRHPLIEAQKRQSKYVTHDVSLGYDDAGQGWLLYGMNASGKSSLMKAIGLAVLLAQVGSYVPATAMTLRPFKKLATRILNQDNLWAGLSSFAVEMSELREILAVSDHQTLVLGDELCAGTESISGTAIVAAGIQYLHKTGARFVLATHLHDLMRIPAVQSLPGLRVWHLHVEYDQVRDLLIYHRTLQEGPGSSMYGLEVAKALHLPRDMIESAFAMRRLLLGKSTAEDAKSSSWNSEHVRKQCTKCGLEIGLETHHMDERHAAKSGRTPEGLDVHHVRNLVTLCGTCHDLHHAEKIVVGPVEDTSHGPIRSIIEVPHEVKKVVIKTPKFNTEEMALIKQVKEQMPSVDATLWARTLRNDYGLDIKDSQLKTLIKKGLI